MFSPTAKAKVQRMGFPDILLSITAIAPIVLMVYMWVNKRKQDLHTLRVFYGNSIISISVVSTVIQLCYMEDYVKLTCITLAAVALSYIVYLILKIRATKKYGWTTK
jgi:uncharacterized membrane protein